MLLIEDDEALRELLEFHLSQASFAVLSVSCAEDAWHYLPQANVVVLDWMLPDTSGVEWLAWLRQTQNDMPVLMLTARASEMDKVTGLNAGADDYLVKPFSAAELIARLRALLRRVKVPQQAVVGELVIDVDQGTARMGNERLELTRREFDLLCFLARHPGRVFSRSELLDRVWGEDFLGTDRTVDQHVAQLRALIGSDYIETVRGRGYRLTVAEY